MEIIEYNISFAPETQLVFEGNAVYGRDFEGYLMNNTFPYKFIDDTHEFIFWCHHPYLKNVELKKHKLYRIRSNGDSRIHLETWSAKLGEFIPYHLKELEPYVWITNNGEFRVRQPHSADQIGTTFSDTYNVFRFASYVKLHNWDKETLHHPKKIGMKQNKMYINELFNKFYWMEDYLLFKELDVFYGYEESEYAKLEKVIDEHQKVIDEHQKVIDEHQNIIEELQERLPELPLQYQKL